MTKTSISRDMQIELARDNSSLEKLYVTGVRKGSAERYHPTDEVAILRKAIKVLYDAVVMQHPDLAERKEIAEMLEWFNAIEKLKESLRSELGIVEVTE